MKIGESEQSHSVLAAQEACFMSLLIRFEQSKKKLHQEIRKLTTSSMFEHSCISFFCTRYYRAILALLIYLLAGAQVAFPCQIHVLHMGFQTLLGHML